MKKKVGTTTGGVLRLVMHGALAATFVLLFASTNSQATFHNDDFYNTTASIANDFHIEFVSATPITVGTQCCRSSPTGTFPAATVSGGGTLSVTLDWSGFTVNPSQKIHVGYNLTSSTPIKVYKSYWTLNGFQIASTLFWPSVNITGGGTNYLLARVTVFDWTGMTLLGHRWVQTLGTEATVTNGGLGLFYARLAVLNVGATPVLETDLNADNTTLNAQLDAVEGPLVAYPVVNIVPAMSVWGMAILVVALMVASFWMFYRRRRAN